MRKNRKNGFTLVELCVVMAVAAIIGTMVVTTMVFVTQQNNDIQKDSSFVTEVTDIQRRVNDWIKKYDNANYEISQYNNAVTGEVGLQAKLKNGATAKGTITFTVNHTLAVDGTNHSDEYKNISYVQFKIVEDTSSVTSGGTTTQRVDGKFVQITITAKKGTGTEQQTLLFALFSNKTRDRSVTGKNG